MNDLNKAYDILWELIEDLVEQLETVQEPEHAYIINQLQYLEKSAKYINDSINLINQSLPLNNTV